MIDIYLYSCFILNISVRITNDKNPKIRTNNIMLLAQMNTRLKHTMNLGENLLFVLRWNSTKVDNHPFLVDL